MAAPPLATIDDLLRFEVKFGGETQSFFLPRDATMGDLRDHLCLLFDVSAAGQKLLGLPKCEDNSVLGALSLKTPTQKIVLMGTRDAAMQQLRASQDAAAAVGSSVLNDLADPPSDEEGDAADALAARHEVYADRIRARIASYKPKMLAGFRGGKRVLVLDVDYTLMDHRTVAERPTDMMRPHLLAFLEAAYHSNYDIVIWSATSMRWIEVKMRELGVTTSTRFSIAAFYDHGAMISVVHASYGAGPVDIKPLPVLWGQHPEHAHAGNTIMFDDLRRNFLANPANGLRIEACRDMPAIRHTDRE